MRTIAALLAIGLTATSFGQVHVPLLGDSTRMWTSSISGSAEGDCMDIWRTTYWFAGDTTIGAYEYRVVSSRERHYREPLIDWCQSMTEYPGTDVYMREEGHQVFGWGPGSADTLIYDFDAQVGDAIPYPYNAVTGASGHHWAEVLMIDSILVDGTYRTRWTTDPGEA